MFWQESKPSPSASVKEPSDNKKKSCSSAGHLQFSKLGLELILQLGVLGKISHFCNLEIGAGNQVVQGI
jgi:hypothetical protein